MPQIPAYLKGLTSHRVRALLNHLNGVSGVVKVNWEGRQLGLRFTAMCTDNSSPHMEQLTWAMAHSEWAGSPRAPDVMDMSANCSHYGPLVGTATLTEDPASGTHTWTFEFHPTAAPQSWQA